MSLSIYPSIYLSAYLFVSHLGVSHMYQTGHPHCTRIHAYGALCSIRRRSLRFRNHRRASACFEMTGAPDFCRFLLVNCVNCVNCVKCPTPVFFVDSFKTSVLPIALTGWELWLTIYIHLAGLGGHSNTLSPGWQVCGCELYNSLPADRWQCEYSLKAGNVRCSESELYWAGLGDWSKKKSD